ncbi:MAG: HU family DNA-binding protein [Tannerella sp.]|jgi:nucleoid DNA-binding protein/nucleoid-associated protein YgaU|nr:HU family DNA-binding protein [Tannerella sp.]
MNEILTSQHLVEILASKTGRDKTQVEAFLRELVAVVNEAVLDEQEVQIKGIGAFKVRLTKERKSYDANTQETVTIPPYHKLAFLPVENFNKQVNRQFESFPSESMVMERALSAGLNIPEAEEDEEIEDEEIMDNPKTEIMEDKCYPIPPVPARVSGKTGVDETANASDLPAGDQQSEITGEEQTQLLDHPLDALSDEATQFAGSVGDENPDETTQVLDCSIEKDLSDEATQFAGSIGEEKPDEAAQASGMPPADEREEKTQLAGAYREKPASPAAENSYGTKARQKIPQFNPTQIALAIVLLLVLGGGVWYLIATRGSGLFHSNKSGWISGESFALPGDSVALEQARQKAKVALEIDSMDASPIAASTDSVLPADEVGEESVSLRPKPESVAEKTTATAGKRTSSTSSGKVLARVTMPAGKRLTLLALKYYGDKIFWVYIYDFNKAKIGSNPDIVPVGMELLIPAKEVYGIDANDAASREKARLLQAEIKGRIK